ncbi:MAG: hypothetical protein ACFBSE_20275, partial [Prochloraceae cyanobacterium]
SHFLGRFRRANELTVSGLGKIAGLGGAPREAARAEGDLARWEKFRFNPLPDLQQLEAIAAVVGVEADRLTQMLPPKGVGMKLSPIRLCSRCFLSFTEMGQYQKSSNNLN